MRSKSEIGEMSMASQAVTPVEAGKSIELKPMQVLTINNVRIVPQTMSNTGILKAVSINPG